VQVALHALDGEPVLAQRREVRAAREQDDIVSRRREPAAEITADRAGRHHADAHANSSFLIRRKGRTGRAS